MLLGAIYGREILINEGYLIANKFLIEEIRDQRTSLIGNLIHGGMARVYARGGTNLSQGIINGIAKIDTHRKILEENPNILKNLDVIAKRANNSILPWPSELNTGHLYWKVLVDDSSPSGKELSAYNPEYRKLFDRVLKRAESEIGDNYQGVRTLIERFAWLEASNGAVTPDNFDPYSSNLSQMHGYEQVRAIMNVANECYHKAQSIAAFASEQRNGKPVLTPKVFTQTHFSRPKYFNINELSSDLNNKHKQQLQSKLDQLILTLNNVRLGNDFSFIQDLELHEGVRETRTQYLNSINEFINEEITFEEAETARNRFASQFAESIQNSASAPIGLKLVKIATNIGASQISSLFASSALGIIGASIVAEALNGLNGTIVKRLHKSIIETQLSADAIKHSQDGQPGELARRALSGHIGYMGELDAAKANELIQGTKPFALPK